MEMQLTHIVILLATGAGVGFAAFVATLLPGNVLKTILGIAIIAGGIRMLTAKPPKIEEHPPENLLPYCCGDYPLDSSVG